MTDLVGVLALHDLFFTAPAEARLGDTLCTNHHKELGHLEAERPWVSFYGRGGEKA